MNKLDKSKSPIAIEEEIEKEASKIFNEWNGYFTNGYRVLFLLQRHKEGGDVNNTKLKKIVTRNPTEYLSALKILIREMRTSDKPLRIYASVNERNFNKSIRKFKYEQLEADYYDQIQKENFYLEIRNRFIGCLMQNEQKLTSDFLFDVDNIEGKDICGETLHVLKDTEIIKVYPTKNGWHIITKAFNYTTIQLPEGVELKKDALLLLAY